jgi:hypothetical protein
MVRAVAVIVAIAALLRVAVSAVYAQLKTGQISDQGALVGSVTCGPPLGRGSYHGRYRDHVVPFPWTGSETGSSKLSFRAGTVRGTYALPPHPISGTAPFHGTFTSLAVPSGSST